MVAYGLITTNCSVELLFRRSAQHTNYRRNNGTYNDRKGISQPDNSGIISLSRPNSHTSTGKYVNYELGVSQTLAGRISLDVTGLWAKEEYHTYSGSVSELTLSNSGSFIHRGVEFSGSAFISSDLHLQTSYSFIDAGKETRSVQSTRYF